MNDSSLLPLAMVTGGGAKEAGRKMWEDSGLFFGSTIFLHMDAGMYIAMCMVCVRVCVIRATHVSIATPPPITVGSRALLQGRQKLRVLERVVCSLQRRPLALCAHIKREPKAAVNAIVAMGAVLPVLMSWRTLQACELLCCPCRNADFL